MMRGRERQPGNLTTYQMKENPAWRPANATLNRKSDVLDGEEGVGQLDSLTGGGGDWAAQWLERGRRGLDGSMA
jgi:hypothetical protein